MSPTAPEPEGTPGEAGTKQGDDFNTGTRRKNAPTNGVMAACKATLLHTLSGAGFLMRADCARPGQNPAAAGPAGTGKSRALRAGTRVAGAVGGARASATHGGGEARHPAAACRRAGADQSGSVAEVSHSSGGDGAVQRVCELQAERRGGRTRGRPPRLGL